MNILKNFAALVKVKTIVTLIVIVIFAVLALRGDISPDNVMIIVTSVIAFTSVPSMKKRLPRV